ncbi:hypothetical protein NJG17_10630 [Stenotrophomonas maltophilia]|uniref:hypothetical protein n=1 Tax=Stenotrophomonas maltophilia TaxID=40324 RepID=UPI00209B8B88|nr:hypothetical protein [Stenotrophomonas maltophilia]MCO7500353.1 hypothetical protein [Stenotrophomonas maltophilia]
MRSLQTALIVFLGALAVTSVAVATHSAVKVNALQSDLERRSVEIASLHSDLRLLRAELSAQPATGESAGKGYDDSKLKDELESLRMRVESVSSYVGTPPEAFGSTSLTDRVDRGFREICVETSHRVCPN